MDHFFDINMPQISGANLFSKQSILLKIKTKNYFQNLQNSRNVVLNAGNVVSGFSQFLLKHGFKKNCI